MVIAADYPFLEIMGTIIVFFAWVAWFWVLISILSDVFRRHDISGWGKAGWTLFVVVLPFLGVLIYLIAQGGKMAERNIEQAKAAQAQVRRRRGMTPRARSRTPSSCSTAARSPRPSSTPSSRRRSS